MKEKKKIEKNKSKDNFDWVQPEWNPDKVGNLGQGDSFNYKKNKQKSLINEKTIEECKKRI